jgi:hypothetical protein
VPVNSNKKWTPDEDKRLLQLKAAGKSNVSIAAALRRSIGSVHGRLAILKAGERFAINPDVARAATPLRKRWTLDDDKRLMELRAKRYVVCRDRQCSRTDAGRYRTTSPYLKASSCGGASAAGGLTRSLVVFKRSLCRKGLFPLITGTALDGLFVGQDLKARSQGKVVFRGP